MYIYIFIYMRHICIRVHIYTCVYIYVCIHTYIHISYTYCIKTKVSCHLGTGLPRMIQQPRILLSHRNLQWIITPAYQTYNMYTNMGATKYPVTDEICGAPSALLGFYEGKGEHLVERGAPLFQGLLSICTIRGRHELSSPHCLYDIYTYI